MATGTSRRGLTRVALAVLLGGAAVVASACGGAGAYSSAAAAPAAPAGEFSWVRPAAAPAAWRTARLASRATLAFPPGWRPVHGDAGTVSAARLGPRGRIDGYLNVTPRSGAETPANWSAFRPRHNAEEGDRAVRLLSTARGLRFAGGTGSCVRDRYTTVTRARYVEIACIVAGRRSAAVIVAAAPPERWAATAPDLHRAIAAFRVG